MNRSALEESVRDAEFDVYAKTYEDDVDQSVSFTGKNSEFYARRKVELLEDIVLRGLGPLANLSVLDVGCGAGTTDRVLAPRVRTLHGVDVSEGMLIKARRTVPGAQFSCYDGQRLPFCDGTFDVAVAMCVLHHVPTTQRRQVVSEMVRVTRRDGIVAVFEHNPFNPLTRRAVSTCDLDRDAVLLSHRETLHLLRMAAEVDAECRHYLFSPLGGKLGWTVDRNLKRVPLGGQYAAWVRRSGALGEAA